MATETLVRPTQTIRRRESSKPLISNKRSADVDLTAGPPMKRSRTLCEPFVRDSQFILKKHRGKPPSLKIHLHGTHFRFDGQDGSFAYDSPMRFVLKHLRLQTVPHDMLEELIGSGVPFYDGCLIVEVHNHRDIEGQKNGARAATTTGDDNKKFSIHNWNPHVTPSSGASFPDKSQLEPDAASAESDTSPEQAKSHEKAEPAVSTIVLHPTEQTMHEEMLILARTPATDVRRKKGGDGSLPTTPQLSASSASARGGPNQKMLLDQTSLYSFHADALVATGPPLLLDPAESADHADQIINSLKHPLHSGVPPPAKERKRTTAEMAADDAQAAENERRMLIMDERIKPSARSGAGAAAGENQSSAASLGFSRFKTIENVKQRLEEQERINAEKEAQAAQEKRQQEEQAAQQKIAQQQQQKARELQEAQLKHRQQMMLQQKHAQQAAVQAQQQQQQQVQQQNIKRMDPQQNMMQMQNQQNGFQHSQAASIAAQQTPLMAHSSPMLGQNGFSMVPTSSQGAGSPPRPTSAVLAQANAIGMSRGGSQQTQNSLHNTPHMPQNGTPSLTNAVPNRNMNQTPHLNPSSPMVGTPTNNIAMNNARLNGNLDPVQQNLMLQQMQQNSQQMNGGQNMNGQQSNGMQAGHGMTPERFQLANQMSQLQEMARTAHAQAQQAAQVGNQNAAQQYMARAQALQGRYTAMRNRILNSQANGGSPVNLQGTPNNAAQQHQNGMQQQLNGNNAGVGTPVNSANQQIQQLAVQQPQGNLTPQQQAMLRSQQELRRLLQVHNGSIPPQIVAQLPQHMQALLRQHHARTQQQMQLQARAQGQARMNGQIGGQGSPQNAAQSAQYMQNMQALRNGLAMQMQGQQQQQQANGQVNGGMNMNNMQQFAQQQRQQGQQQNGGVPDLSQSFAAMQNAIARGHNV